MWTWLGLRKEAVLLDSHLYIIKAMTALIFAYSFATRLPLVSLDLVSVLLGVMYNLEAANVLGLKGGLNQLLASTLGALVSGVVVVLFGYQIGAFSVALSMGLTMWVALKIDYRLVSPVAIFTSLYMNLLLQSNSLNQVSIGLTFAIRLAALSFGIGVALLFNFIFSFVYYQNLAFRRLELVKTLIVQALNGSLEHLTAARPTRTALDSLVSNFNDVDTTKRHVESLLHERFTLSVQQRAHVETILASMVEYKNILHLIYDVLYLQQAQGLSLSADQIQRLQGIAQQMSQLDFTREIPTPIEAFKPEMPEDLDRLEANVARMEHHHRSILQRHAKPLC
jgi:hypothetical protein